METKQQQRKHIIEQKKQFMSQHSLSQRLEFSEKILSELELLPEFRSAKIVLAYNSLLDEVDTHSFINRWWKEKTILLPKVVGDDLSLHPYKGEASVAKGAFGIEEPITPVFNDFEKIDLVVVPGMAFDPAGNRLGRGRGYYDRLFHHRLPDNITRVGVCYPFQLLPYVVVDTADVKMHKVICGQG